MAATRRPQAFEMHGKGKHQQAPQNGLYPHVYEEPAPSLPTRERGLATGPSDPSIMKKSMIQHNGADYQLIPAEIEKDPELGLVIGHIQTDDWIFIDEVLPNGMIDMHGILKEGDYLIQAGVYSLVGIDVSTALILIERAYDEGKKTVTFVAARAEKNSASKANGSTAPKTRQAPPPRHRPPSPTPSFIQYEEKGAAQGYSDNPGYADETHF